VLRNKRSEESPKSISSCPPVISSKTLFSESSDSLDWSTYRGATVSPTFKTPSSGFSCHVARKAYQKTESSDAM